MAQSTAEKLGMKPGTLTLVGGRSLAETAALLGTLPDGATLSTGTKSADLVLFFADDVASVREHIPAAFERMAPAGRFWVAYRKGASRRAEPGQPAPLHRDTLQAALATLGLDGVTLIALDDTWSAMRVKAV